MEKRELRRMLRERAGALPAAYLADASAKIAALATAFPPYLESRSIFVYVSTAREPDTAGILEHAWSSGKTVYVPKCLGGGIMKAVRIESRAELSPGRIGILEPPDGLPEASPGEIGLAVVPCVGAARDGRRLGHGGGYYDRFLAEARAAVKLCLCFERLLSEEIPVDGHDIWMDSIVTETEILERSAYLP